MEKLRPPWKEKTALGVWVEGSKAAMEYEEKGADDRTQIVAPTCKYYKVSIACLEPG